MRKSLALVICILPLLAAMTAEGLFPEYQWSAALWMSEMSIACAGLCAVLGRVRRMWRLRTVDISTFLLIVWCILVDCREQTFSACRLFYWTALWLYFLIIRESSADVKNAVPKILALLTLLCALSEMCEHYAGWGRPLFNNEAGYAAALALGVPFLLGFSLKMWRNNILWQRVLVMAVLVITSWAILLTNSRAAWFSLLLSGFLCIAIRYKHKICTRKKQIVTAFLSVLAITVCVWGLYKIRPASADGRLLIYQVAAQCVEQFPITGHGSMGILRDYMPEQAAFFAMHPEHPATQLAGNVPYAFNEAIGFTLKYGIVGLSLFVFAIVEALKNTTCRKNLTLCSVCIIMAGMSVFSYPTAWTYAILLFVLVVGKEFTCDRKGITLRFPIASVFVIVCCLIVSKHIDAENKWLEASTLTENGDYRKGLRLYRQASATLSDRPDFLYNYAAELNAAERFEESNEQMRLCTRLLNDCDTELLIADNYMAMQQWRQALPHLQTATLMVPSRFMPLYGLMQVYDAMGDRQKARNWANTILHKSVKIPSPDIDDIKETAFKYLQASKQQTND